LLADAAWNQRAATLDFEKRGKTVEVDVTGSLISGDSELAIRAALDGVAIARVPYYAAEAHIAAKTLVPILEDWRPRSVGPVLSEPPSDACGAPGAHCHVEG